MTKSVRQFAELTSNEIVKQISVESILCLPIGATEQHGPHLPLNTDTIIANSVARRIVDQFHDRFDLWLLPTLEYGLSPEHLWAPGTISLSADVFGAVFHGLIRGLIAAQAARNLLIVNGHGGNRGVLEALILECRVRYGLTACVVHPSALSNVSSGSEFCEVHGGKSETSMMLALAPELVRLDHLPLPMKAGDTPDVQNRVIDRGVSWPWNSNDPGIGRDGIIGDAGLASAVIGDNILIHCVQNAERVLRSLIEYGRIIRVGQQTNAGDRS